jgi:hypothetical protein
MSMQDSLEVVKKLASDPLPYVNGGVFLGMNTLDWDLAMKVIIGLGTILFTWIKVWYEWKKLQETKSRQGDKKESES